jgi:hypothetical protein
MNFSAARSSSALRSFESLYRMVVSTDQWWVALTGNTERPFAKKSA